MSQPELIRGLGLRDATALVIGTIIGTGVFLKTTPMAQAVGAPQWILLAWIVAGMLSLAGALTYAKLGALLPQAGGEYVYLRTAYGELPAFLFGWMRITVGGAGSIAIAGVAQRFILAAHSGSFIVHRDVAEAVCNLAFNLWQLCQNHGIHLPCEPLPAYVAQMLSADPRLHHISQGADLWLPRTVLGASAADTPTLVGD